MKKIVLAALVFILNLSISAQPGMFERDKELPYTNPKPMYLEAHLFEKDSGYVCFVSYKVSLSNLVFTKNNGDYTGGITLNIEALKKNGNVVRSSTTDEIHVKNYADTEARDKFLEGVLSFYVDEYLYELNPLIGITNTEREFPMPPIRLEEETMDEPVPIVVKKVQKKCSASAAYLLYNFGNSIPYGTADADMLIPAPSPVTKNIYVELKQDDIIIKRDTLSKPVPHNFYVEKCGDNIYLSDSGRTGAKKYFLMPAVSAGLHEGKVTVSVSSPDSLLSENQFDVIWYQKPRSLFNPETAFKLLEVIADGDTLDDILDRNKHNYFLALREFWNARNPEGNTSYNPLEAEFYNRVDYALKEYGVRGDRSMNLSDRGEVYVKYGKPSDVERVFTGKDEITEIWKYNGINLQFIFLDTSGLGDFKLK